MELATMQLEATPSAPRRSRVELEALRPRLEPRFDDALLVTAELVANAVRHTESQQVSVSIRADGDVVRIAVSDEGPCFGKGDDRGGGLGLLVVSRLARAWGIDRGDGCTVWAELAGVGSSVAEL